MYAVFSTGGKQYRAATGDVIKVEKLDAEEGATVELDRVLMVGEGEDVEVGTPFVAGGKVTAKVVEHGRGDKVRIIKFKRRKHHMKRMGHRQHYTMLEITGIAGAKSGKPEAKAEKPGEPAERKAPARKAAPKKSDSKKAASRKAASKKSAVKSATADEAKSDE